MSLGTTHKTLFPGAAFSRLECCCPENMHLNYTLFPSRDADPTVWGGVWNWSSKYRVSGGRCRWLVAARGRSYPWCLPASLLSVLVSSSDC